MLTAESTPTLQLTDDADSSESIEGVAIGKDRRHRTHPDLFTPIEATEYLNLPSVRSLETLRKDWSLIGLRAGKGYLYHRAHLDACTDRMFGLDQPSVKPTSRN